MIIRNRYIYIFSLCIPLIILGCSSSAPLASTWNKNEIIVDGNGSEWNSQTIYLNEQHLSLGIRNDADYLYLCLKSTEGQFRRQIMGLGLTISFSKENSKEMLGVHYPIGFLKQGRPPIEENPNNDNEQPIDRERLLEQALQDFEILGPGLNDHRTFSILQSTDITAKIKSSQDLITYELRIPLHKTSEIKYALNADTGSTLQLKIETGKFDRSGFTGSMQSGGMTRGNRRGGGMRTEDEPEEGQAPRANRPEPLKFEAVIRLAGTS